MAVVGLIPPRLPTAPDTYSENFMSDLVKAIELFIQQERTAGEQRGTKIVLTALPTSDTGLEVGSLFRIGNDIKISLLDIAVPDSLEITASVGDVDIVIT